MTEIGISGCRMKIGRQEEIGRVWAGRGHNLAQVKHLFLL